MRRLSGAHLCGLRTGHHVGMRDALPEFFPADFSERFVTEAIIVPDSNVLLSLYRWSPATRDEAVEVLRKVADRLWFPHQVCREYLTNRLEVLGVLDAQYDKTHSALREARKKLSSYFDEGRRYESSREAVKKAIDKAFDQLESELAELRENDSARVSADDDHVLALVEELASDRIGARPSADIYRQRVREFVDHRQPLLIPPGYLDGDKEGVAAAGDYLIWREILDHARHADRPILFITDDQKDDWYEGKRGARTGPRRELVAEFAEHSSAGYHQMGFDRFIRDAKTYLDVEVHEEAVSEIREDSTRRLWEELADLAASNRAAGGLKVRDLMRASLAEPDEYSSALERAARDGMYLSRLEQAARDHEPWTLAQQYARDGLHPAVQHGFSEGFRRGLDGDSRGMTGSMWQHIIQRAEEDRELGSSD